MTVSMLTTRLSSVITGCGGNETTCSRRSISGRTRSMNGTISAKPGVSVRLERRSRSTTRARACGTMRIERESVATTNAATTRMTISATTGAPSCSFVDERRCALDLCDFDARAGLEDLVRHERARRPLLAAEADAAAVVVD